MKIEPLVTEEQGVVYLFSRYFKDIAELKEIKELHKIGTRFPDAIYSNYKRINGIEFESNLSAIRSHYPNKYNKKIKKNQFLDFYYDSQYSPDRTLSFFIIYWFEDESEATIRKEINKKCENKFKLKLVNLSEYFNPIVIKDPKLKAIKSSLIFKTKKNNGIIRGAYSYTKINNHYKKLKNLKKLISKRTGENAIRLIGHNLKETEDLTLQHWKKLRFYNTTSKIRDCKLQYLLLNNKEEGLLILKIEKFFKFTKKRDSQIKKFFSDFYFERLDPGEDYRIPNCVIFRKTKMLDSVRDNKTIKKILRYFKNVGQPKGGVIPEKPNTQQEKYNSLKRIVENIM